MALSTGETARLVQDNSRIQAFLEEHGLQAEPYPLAVSAGWAEGAAAARAYPIQGILKYHGLVDWDLRTAYLPSISVNNDAAYSLTLVQFDAGLTDDRVAINGAPADARARTRVVQTLDTVRTLARIDTRASVDSKNVTRASRVGKGLGTSASASAALAMAAISATLGPEMAQNRRLLSCTSRLLAGSGCRSATGGVSLWLSYPGVSHEDSYAVRIDRHDELAEVSLITVPIDSRIALGTESAHRDAPHSPFFAPWCLSRGQETIECLRAVLAGDWRTLARWAELDSIRLHGVTMSGSLENKLFAWEPENITLFRLCNDLRSSGVPVYFSTDTGPTMVMITHRSHAAEVVAAIEGLQMGLEVVRGGIAGPAELVSVDDARHELGLT
ncbi:MAG: diphosphomevalonate decarboxylase [Anaerolineae bacterium]